MDQGQFQFSKRLRRLDRKHRAMERGYSTFVRPDGLIVAKPKSRRPRIALKPLLLCIVGFFLFKSVLMIQLGTAVYSERVDQLSGGTVVEQAGAWAMQPDAITVFISGQISDLVSRAATFR